MTRATRRFAPLLLALAVATAGCATTQPYRDNTPGSTPVAGTDEAELWYAMEEAEADLARSPMRVRDPALEQYVRDVACRSSAGYCKDLRVYVMNVPAFNASMAPNGMMMVWTGALLRMRDEAELAFVLAHEAGHFRAQHSLRQWRRMKDTSALLGAFQMLASGYGVPDLGMLGSLGVYATLFKFSRDMEREADVLGFETVVAEGYDPNAGADLWARMLREENTVRGSKSTVFASHPATEERLADVKAAAARVPQASTRRNVEQYRAATRPFLKDWLVAELAQRRYDSSILVIRELLEDAPAADRGLLTFALGEAYRRRDAEGDRVRARDLYVSASKMDGVPPEGWRELGFALQKAGNPTGARRAFEQYLQAAPDAEDRAFVQRAMEKLGGTP